MYINVDVLFIKTSIIIVKINEKINMHEKKNPLWSGKKAFSIKSCINGTFRIENTIHPAPGFCKE